MRFWTKSRMSKLPIIILAASLLAGCASNTSLIPTESLYPTALTQCAPEPRVPDRPAPDQPRSGRDKATYVKNLHGAYLNCQDVVEGWKERRSLYADQYEHAKYGYFERLWRSATGRSDRD